MLNSTITTHDRAKNELLAALNSTATQPKDINLCLARYAALGRVWPALLTPRSYRNEADKVIMNNLHVATETEKEQTLWHQHVRVHKQFQKALHTVSCNCLLVHKFRWRLKPACSCVKITRLSNIARQRRATLTSSRKVKSIIGTSFIG